MTNFNIEIVSDTICAWCYIGKRRLDRAVAIHRKTYPSGSQDKFNISWTPYYLKPNLSETSTPLSEAMTAKLGAERKAAVEQRVLQAGRAEGISFSLGSHVGNTRDSHRLLHLAKLMGGPELQTRVAEEVFREHFERDGDITDLKMLCKAGTSAGIDETEVKQWLESGEGGDTVDEGARLAKEKPGTGVPRFFVQGELIVDGADDVGAFLEAFAKVKEQSL